MKTKLLKEIRQRFKIFEYPNRKVYKFLVKFNPTFTEQMFLSNEEKNISFEHKTIQSAKDCVLRICRIIYFDHSKKYKLTQVKRKVWYNGSI